MDAASSFDVLTSTSHDTRHHISGSPNLSIHRHESPQCYKILKVVSIINYPSHHKQVRGLYLQFHATYKIMESFTLRPPYSQEESRGCPFDGMDETSGLCKLEVKFSPCLIKHCVLKKSLTSALDGGVWLDSHSGRFTNSRVLRCPLNDKSVIFIASLNTAAVIGGLLV